MTLLWSSPLPSSEVCKRCAEAYGWSPSTCKTYLSRLEKRRGSFKYRAKVREGECLGNRARDLAEETCKCDQKEMLIKLIEECPLTEEEAEEVKRALEEKILRARREPEPVQCECEGGKNGCGC